MKRILVLASLLASVGCAEPQPVYYYVETRTVEPAMPCMTYGTCGVNDAVAKVDARREQPDDPNHDPTKPHARAPNPNAPPEERYAEPARSAPTGEPQRPTALESREGSYVIQNQTAKPMNRYELDALINRCKTRPTRWAREQCMAGK